MDSPNLMADFRQALGQLEDALRAPAGNDVYKAGCIQYFEFTFELAWKTLKNMAEDEGMTVPQIRPESRVQPRVAEE